MLIFTLRRLNLLIFTLLILSLLAYWIEYRLGAGDQSLWAGYLQFLNRLLAGDLAAQGITAGAAAGDRVALIDLLSPGQATEYWLGYENFYVISRYNRSSFYAMAVFQLAEALRQRFCEQPNATATNPGKDCHA